MNKKETTEEFIARLRKLPNLDLTDPQTIKDFSKRISEKTRKEIDKSDLVFYKRNGPRVFWRY